MEIHVHNVCRGASKVFFNLGVSGIDDGDHVVIGACTGEGAAVPIMAFPGGGPVVMRECSQARSFDVVLPQVPNDVTVIVNALDDSGALIAECRHVVRPQVAKWGSRVNGRLRAGALAVLRNCDAKRTLCRAVFELNDALTPFEADNPMLGMSLVRGVAYVPCELAPEPPKLRCLDADMCDFPEAFRTWPARRLESSKNMTAPLWMIPFTLPMPSDSEFAVFIACDSKTGEVLPGFDSLDKGRLLELRSRADYVYGSARWDSRWHDEMVRRRPTPSELVLQRKASKSDGLAFSIVVPLFRTPLNLLQDVIGSIRAQSYERWQLVLVNASPEDEALSSAVRGACASDGRIVEVQLSENMGITLNTNEGIKAATGDFIAFMDHDDVIEPDLLFEYARAIAEHPETDVLYCDEDKISPAGRYVEPYFKPDFDIDLLRGNNYVCHMLCVRASLLRELPERGAEYDGAQDHALTLMAAERTRHIRHVPKVLYHWRQVEGSTAGGKEGKPYAQTAGKLAVSRHLERMGLAGQVSDGLTAFTYRVDYDIAGEPLVSIVIPSRDHVDLLASCLASIREKTTYGNYEVIVVENNSAQPQTFEYYEQVQWESPNVRVVTWEGEGFNYSELVNFGVAHAHGDYFVLLNNDVEVITPEWIEGMLGLCQREDVGVVGAKLLFPDDTVQHGGVVIGANVAEHLHLFQHRFDHGYVSLLCHVRALSAVTAACLMTKRSVYDEVGGFDTAFAVAYNDVDFCLRVRTADKLVLFTPRVELYHYESLSRGSDQATAESRERIIREASMMRQRWAHYYVAGDPYYNPNLEQTSPGIRAYHLKV